LNILHESVSGILVFSLTHCHGIASFLDVFQNVGVIDVIFDGISDWVVPGNVLELEVRFPLTAFFLLFDLVDNVLSKHHLVAFLLLHLFLLLQPLVVFEFLESLILLIFLILFNISQILLVL
jgi:hypothetical protein